MTTSKIGVTVGVEGLSSAHYISSLGVFGHSRSIISAKISGFSLCCRPGSAPGTLPLELWLPRLLAELLAQRARIGMFDGAAAKFFGQALAEAAVGGDGSILHIRVKSIVPSENRLNSRPRR